MASIKPTTEAPPPIDNHSVAQHAVRCLYGCGITESIAKLAIYDEKTIASIADQERQNRRDRIPAIIAKALPKK